MLKSVKAIVLTLVVTAGILVAPQAAFANGGCHDSPTWNGWQIGSCVSASGNVLNPDYYVNQSGTKPSGCTVNSYRYSGGSSTLLNSRSCSSTGVGHYGPFSHIVGVGPALCYQHRVRVGPINGVYMNVYSPAWCY